MSLENSTTMNLCESNTKNNNTIQEEVSNHKSGFNPFKALLLASLGLFGLITLVIISWPLIAWIGSLRVG